MTTPLPMAVLGSDRELLIYLLERFLRNKTNFNPLYTLTGWQPDLGNSWRKGDERSNGRHQIPLDFEENVKPLIMRGGTEIARSPP